MPDNPAVCADCSVRPGSYHRPRCDVARCAVTGRQLSDCRHPGTACGNTVWTGQWPGDAECWEYGFLILPSDAEAAAGVPPFTDLNRLYAECDWDSAAQRMVLRAPAEGTARP
ncbi:hypothetical protein [Streptomyces sp. CAU 1734]|uniref:hypothetical protein n=1 Tax=Streptomyces sp. CAU 1734 TaxID=3140360 RepID=UPI0032612AB4